MSRHHHLDSSQDEVPADRIYVEGQWDPKRGTVTLVASNDSGGRHAVTVVATTEEEANARLADWVSMYRTFGGEVVQS